MKKCLYLAALLFLYSTTLVSQKLEWGVSSLIFFDNTEFAGSQVQLPQTMAGVRIAPEVGLGWDSIHHLHIGVNALQEFGSIHAVDGFAPTVYYSYDYKPFRFYMGAFPRSFAVDNYPRMFFQDSIAYYRPNINGLFWEIYNTKGNFNVWLDWTGRQTNTERETFFMGFSGRYQIGVFYAQHFGSIYHYALRKNVTPPDVLYDNGLFLTSLGIDVAKPTGFEKLELNAGWAIGIEDARGVSSWLFHNALLVEAKVEYRGIGLFNSLYVGDGQMAFYNDERNELYWGDPIYRLNTYNRTDFYLEFFRSERVNTRLVYSLHFAENMLYHEQSLKVSVDINSDKKADRKPYQYLWSDWFRK